MDDEEGISQLCEHEGFTLYCGTFLKPSSCCIDDGWLSKHELPTSESFEVRGSSVGSL